MRSAGGRSAAIWLAAALAAAGLVPWAAGQSIGRDSGLTQSRSGQFTAQFLYRSSPDRSLVANPALVRIDPAVVVVTCERVREILWRELEVRGPWVSKVAIVIFPAVTGNEGATVSADRFRNGWQYHLYLPQMVDRVGYVRALTEVVVRELANRGAGGQGAEIPAWLREGLCRRILALDDPRLVLPSADDRGGRPVPLPVTDLHMTDPLTRAHEVLSGVGTITFQELTWADETRMGPEEAGVFGCAAQLLVTRLVQFPDGHACLRNFVAGLSQHYNWQFAFLPAFRGHFSRPLEVEKWWAVQSAEFVGRRLDQTWATDTSLARLSQAILTGIEVRTAADQMPLHADARLQSVVGQWNSATQGPVLEAKLVELGILRSQVAPNLVPLVDEYRKTIEDYLRHRDTRGLLGLPVRREAARRRNAENTIARLNALDERRQTLVKVNTPLPGDRSGANPPAPQGGEIATDLGGAFSRVPTRSPVTAK